MMYTHLIPESCRRRNTACGKSCKAVISNRKRPLERAWVIIRNLNVKYPRENHTDDDYLEEIGENTLAG